MSDAELIQNLNEKSQPHVGQFTDKQWLFLNDYNNSDYTNQIQFDTITLKNQYIDYYEGYLSIPLQVTNTNAASVVPLMAMKASTLSLISGLVITDGQGAVICQDQNIQFINNLRLVVEKSYDWINSEGAEILFAKDQNTASNPNFSGGNSSIPSAFGLRSLFVLNSGTQTLIYDSGVSVNTFNFTAKIPLRLIHDFFDKLDFPLLNMRFQMNFILAAGASGNSITPYQTASTANVVDTSIVPEYPPYASSSGADAAVTTTLATGIAVTIRGPCRLYYPKITLAEGEARMQAQRLSHGDKRRMEFIITDSYINQQLNSTANIQQTVSTATVKPLRLWALLYPAGAIKSTTTASPLVATGMLTNANVLINNNQYYIQNLQYQTDFWNILKDQFPNYGGASNTLGSMINYSDFCSLYRYYCFDISRLKDRLINPNEAVSIVLQANRAEVYPAPAACDYIYLVEKMQTIIFDFSSAEVKFIIGQNL